MTTINDLAGAFKALAEPHRIRILKMLAIRPLCVCEITEILQLAPSTVSKHLTMLRDAGFIMDQKEGKWVNYYLEDNSNRPCVRELQSLLSQWLGDDETIRRDAELVRIADRYEICKV